MTRADPGTTPPSDDDRGEHDELPHDEPHWAGGARARADGSDEETVYYEGSPMLRGELGKVLGFGLIGLLLILAPFVYRYFAEEWPLWWITTVLVILGIALLFIPWLFVKSIRYRVTNFRIDYERGIFSRNVDTLELWHVDDIRYHQSLLDRMLNVGTITVMSDDQTTPQLPLYGIPNPRPVFDALKARVIAVKRTRGVIKMDTGD